MSASKVYITPELGRNNPYYLCIHHAKQYLLEFHTLAVHASLVIDELKTYRKGLTLHLVKAVLDDWLRTLKWPLAETSQDIITAYQTVINKQWLKAYK